MNRLSPLPARIPTVRVEQSTGACARAREQKPAGTKFKKLLSARIFRRSFPKSGRRARASRSPLCLSRESNCLGGATRPAARVAPFRQSAPRTRRPPAGAAVGQQQLEMQIIHLSCALRAARLPRFAQTASPRPIQKRAPKACSADERFHASLAPNGHCNR